MAKGEQKHQWGYDSSAIEREMEGQPFVDGFGPITILGGLFVAFVMVPAGIYLFLVAGASMGPAAQWTTIILFTEIARRAFKSLNKQQIYILYYMLGGVIVAGGPFFNLIFHQFLVTSNYAQQYGIADELNSPKNDWIAPAIGSEALTERTFWHPDWIPAIAVVVVFLLLERVIRFSMGYVLFRITADAEQLPFPLAPVAAEGATALAEAYEPGQRWRWRVFSSGSAIGILFGTIYVVVPTLTGAIMEQPIQLLPIPWIDLCTTFEDVLPAASIGIATDIGGIFLGFVLPFALVVGQFVGAILTYVVANPILYEAGVLTQWRYGMETIQTTLTNEVDFWLGFKIGALLVVATLGVFTAVKVLRSARAKDSSIRYFEPPAGRGDFPLPVALLLWAACTGILVWLCAWCVPDFPVWIFVLYGFVITPINSYVSARMVGLAAQTVQIPFIKEGSFMVAAQYQNYAGVGIWFAPIPLFDHGSMTQLFKEMTLTRTKFTSVLKAEVIIFPIIIIAGILFMSLLWTMAPIPSAAYPFVARLWPLEVEMRCLWATATISGESYFLEAITLEKIGIGYGVGMLVFLILKAASAPPLVFYGMISGMAGGMPHSQFMPMLGALLGRYVFAKKFGEENWRRYTPVLMAGFAAGMGIAGMLSIGIAMIAKSVIELPY